MSILVQQIRQIEPTDPQWSVSWPLLAAGKCIIRLHSAAAAAAWRVTLHICPGYGTFTPYGMLPTTRHVEMGFKKPRLLGFYQKNRQGLVQVDLREERWHLS